MHIAANRTSHRELLAIGVMLGKHQAALGTTTALRKLVRFVLADVVAFALASVTVFTEMSSTPAVPLGG